MRDNVTDASVAAPAVTHELRIYVPENAKGKFSEFLLNIGLSGFVEGSIECDIEFEYGNKHLQHDYYAEHEDVAGPSPFVFFSALKEEIEEYVALIREHIVESGIKAEDLKFEYSVLPDSQWKESWKDSFRPLFVGNELVILPPWEDASKFSAPVKIIIDPGMAFGTGQHETTQLCLSLYLYHTERVFQKVFDIGTGSGILAFAAHKLGCRQVLGSDIDPDSVRIARENAVINQCESIQFTDENLDRIDSYGHDLIFANIQLKPLSVLMKDIVARGAPHCTYIFSGILTSEQEAFFEKMKENGLNPSFVTRQGDWLGIIARLSQ